MENQTAEQRKSRANDLRARIEIEEYNVTKNGLLNIKYFVEGDDFEKHFFADKELTIQTVVGEIFDDYNPKFDHFISTIEMDSIPPGVIEERTQYTPFDIFCKEWVHFLEPHLVKNIIINHELKKPVLVKEQTITEWRSKFFQ